MTESKDNEDNQDTRVWRNEWMSGSAWIMACKQILSAFRKYNGGKYLLDKCYYFSFLLIKKTQLKDARSLPVLGPVPSLARSSTSHDEMKINMHYSTHFRPVSVTAKTESKWSVLVGHKFTASTPSQTHTAIKGSSSGSSFIVRWQKLNDRPITFAHSRYTGPRSLKSTPKKHFSRTTIQHWLPVVDGVERGIERLWKENEIRVTDVEILFFHQRQDICDALSFAGCRAQLSATFSHVSAPLPPAFPSTWLSLRTHLIKPQSGVNSPTTIRRTLSLSSFLKRFAEALSSARMRLASQRAQLPWH